MSNIGDAICAAYEARTEPPKDMDEAMRLWREYWFLVGLLCALDDEKEKTNPRGHP